MLNMAVEQFRLAAPLERDMTGGGSQLFIL